MPQSKDPELERTGTIVESLPNIMFRVKLDPSTGSHSSPSDARPSESRTGQVDTDEEVLSYLSGKMRLHRIRVLVGDKVLLELEPYGGKARIIKRL
jgi:translation initiation factor IF-1